MSENHSCFLQFRFDLCIVCVCVVHVSSFSAQSDEDVSTVGFVFVHLALQYLPEQHTNPHLHQHFPANVDSTSHRSTQIHTVERFDASLVPLLFSSPVSSSIRIIVVVVTNVDAIHRRSIREQTGASAVQWFVEIERETRSCHSHLMFCFLVDESLSLRKRKQTTPGKRFDFAKLADEAVKDKEEVSDSSRSSDAGSNQISSSAASTPSPAAITSGVSLLASTTP